MKLRTFADALLLLEDMRDYALNAVSFSEGKGIAELRGDEQHRFSILYALQVVGEAASRMPEPVREMAPEVP